MSENDDDRETDQYWRVSRRKFGRGMVWIGIMSLCAGVAGVALRWEPAFNRGHFCKWATVAAASLTALNCVDPIDAAHKAR